MTGLRGSVSQSQVETGSMMDVSSSVREAHNQAIEAARQALFNHAVAAASRLLAKRPNVKPALSERSAKAVCTVTMRTWRDELGRLCCDVEWSESVPPAEVVNTLSFGQDGAIPEPAGGAAGAGAGFVGETTG